MTRQDVPPPGGLARQGPGIPPCPTCGGEVEQVKAVNYKGGPGSTTWAEPCHHKVTVTVWPDRIELAR